MVESAIVSTITIPVAADRPPRKTASASSGRPSAIGNARTNVSASTVAAGKVQQSAERDRQHEQVDREHVQREQPARLGDVPLVDVLDDGDLELPRQAQDRERRQHEQPGPARVAPGRSVERREQVREARIRRDAGEQVAETAVEPERDEQPDGEEGDELDDRLERDRRDHPLVALGGVEMTRAEQDRERRERERGVERGVGEQRYRCRRARTSRPRARWRAAGSFRTPPSAAARCRGRCRPPRSR